MQNKTTILKVTHYLQRESNKVILPIEASIKMGRESGIRLFHSSVSAEHCEFIPQGIGLFVKDLGSTNGTYVNRRKLAPGEECILQNGDHIHIGALAYIYSDFEPAAPAVYVEKNEIPKRAKPSWNFSFLRWCSYALSGYMFYWIANHELMNAMLVSGNDRMFIGSALRQTPSSFWFWLAIVLFGCLGAHAYISQRWMNRSRFPRVGRILRAGAFVGILPFMLLGAMIVGDMNATPIDALSASFTNEDFNKPAPRPRPRRSHATALSVDTKFVQDQSVAK